MKKIKILTLVLSLAMLVSVFCSCAKNDAESSVAMDIGKAEIAEDGTSGGNASLGSTTSASGNSNPEFEPKIVKTANLTAETKSYDTAVSEIERIVAERGGYMESSTVGGRNYSSSNAYYSRNANFTIRIPAESLDGFLEDSGRLLNVTSTETKATDISNQYYDTQARLDVLRTEKEVLEDMLSKATSVSTMLEIEKRLYDVIYEIESYETTIRLYDSQVAYSTVTLTLYEVTDLTVVNQNPSFTQRIKTAFSESWKNFAAFCKDFAVNFVYALPTLLILGAIITPITVLTVKKIKKRRAAKKSNDDSLKF